MYPSKIPSLHDVNLVLSSQHNIAIPRNVYQESWRPNIPPLWGAMFNRLNPLPSRYLPTMPRKTRLAAALEDDTRGYTRDKNRHILDELYHWLTGFEELPEVTKENLIIRITHPTVVYSMVTQVLVTRYKDQYGLPETQLLLKESYVKWNKLCTHPLKYWNLIYKTHTGLLWPIRSAQTTLHDWLTAQLTSNSYQEDSNNSSFLKQYNTKATDYFSFKYGKHPAYKLPLGIELELENLTEKGKIHLNDTLNTHAIFKRDGSVSRGVEICTAPATLDLHKEAFKGFFNGLPTSGLQALNNCGLHVHVERQDIKPPQMAKILRFMNNPDNNLFIETLAGRKANNYCATEAYDWGTGLQANDSNKYRRINLTNEHTIEFRLFASTVDFNQFTRCLDFVQAIMDYTKPGVADCSIKEFLNKDSFTKYVNKERQFYPDLYKYLNNKVTILPVDACVATTASVFTTLSLADLVNSNVSTRSWALIDSNNNF